MKSCIMRHLYLLVIVIFLPVLQAKKAVVIVPVADLVGKPIALPNTTCNYNNIPLAAGSSKQADVCPRLHQLIFNEIVDVIEEQKNELCVNVSNIYYLIPPKANPQIRYWTHKNNLVFLEDLEKNKLDLKKIPKPITFNDKLTVHNENNIVTLLFPWSYSKTLAFSAGTRFVLSSKQPHKQEYTIYILDHTNMNFKEITIRKNLVCRSSDLHTNEDRRALFVQLLKKWANPGNGFIPYVWGGCSFINVYTTDFKKHELNNNFSYFARDEIKSCPKNGCDCSGLIARTAQACGIPYFFKNTTTMVNKLDALQKNDTLHDGDLMWMPGHVMAVASIKDNTIIEARSYGSGYGKIHELPLYQVFKNINSYSDLLQHYFANKPLGLLNKDQEVKSTLTSYKLLKLASVWK